MKNGESGQKNFLPLSLRFVVSFARTFSDVHFLVEEYILSVDVVVQVIVKHRLNNDSRLGSDCWSLPAYFRNLLVMTTRLRYVMVHARLFQYTAYETYWAAFCCKSRMVHVRACPGDLVVMIAKLHMP